MPTCYESIVDVDKFGKLCMDKVPSYAYFSKSIEHGNADGELIFFVKLQMPKNCVQVLISFKLSNLTIIVSLLSIVIF